MSIIRDGIKLYFDRMFKLWNDEQQSGRHGGVHASDLIRPSKNEDGDRFDSRFCYRECLLKSFYKPNTEEESTEGYGNGEYSNRIFLNGWKLHIKWQELFEKYCKVIAIEKAEYNEKHIPVWFTPDAIINFMGRDIIVEIKGYKAEKVDKLDENGPPPESAEIQAHFYMYLTNIKDAVILVENKNTQVFKVWHLEFDISKVQHIIDRMEKIKLMQEKWKENHKYLPPRICTGETCSRANMCSMSNSCFEITKFRDENYLQDKYNV